MKIEQALRILGLKDLPSDERSLQATYRELAKKMHPDAGGSEEAFQELGAARDYVSKALILLEQRKSIRGERDEALAKKRAILREQMLRRRAIEDLERNKVANRWIRIIGILVVAVILRFSLAGTLNHWMIERYRVERMAEVSGVGTDGQYTVRWDYNSKTYTQLVKGRFIDGKWAVGSSGMPVVTGVQFIVAFNGDDPGYFELLEKYIHPNTAELYFAMVKPSIELTFGMEAESPEGVCLFWSVLDEFGVDGLAHLMFSQTPTRINWYHNHNTFEALQQTETFQNLYTSCVQSSPE